MFAILMPQMFSMLYMSDDSKYKYFNCVSTTVMQLLWNANTLFCYNSCNATIANANTLFCYKSCNATIANANI